MARGAVAFIYIVFIPIAGIAASGQVGTSYYSDLIFLVYDLFSWALWWTVRGSVNAWRCVLSPLLVAVWNGKILGKETHH